MASVSDILKKLDQYDKSSAGIGLQLRLDLVLIILNGLRAKNWTLSDLAEHSCLDMVRLEEIVNSEEDCTLETIGRICNTLDIKVSLVSTSPGGTSLE